MKTRRIILTVFIALAAIGGYLAWAALSQSWTFTTAGNYAVSDSGKIEVADGVVKLVVDTATYKDDTISEYNVGYDAGAAEDTYVSTASGPDASLVLTDTVPGTYDTPGVFTSRVFDGGASNTWQRIDSSYTESGGGTEISTGETGLVSLWHMNNDWLDATANNNDGTAVGDATFTSLAKLGSHAGSFDGTGDSVNISLAGLSVASGTVEAWTYSVDLTTGQAYVFQHYNAGSRIYLSANWPATGDFWIRVGDLGNTDTGADFIENTWQHVALTWDNGAYTAYMDGAIVSTGNYSGLTGFLSTYNFISSNWNGYLDEVAIYNMPLDATTIASHYVNGVAVRFQVRSGSSATLTTSYVGPTGASSYYAGVNESLQTSGTDFVLTDQYVQYQATLNASSAASQTPNVDSVAFVGSAGSVFDNTSGDYNLGTYTSNTTVSPASTDKSFVGLSKMANGGYNSYGTYTSQVFDSAGANWDSIAWTYGGEIPTDYPGIVSLWHMNGDWNDAQGSNNGTATGATFSTSAKLGSYAGSFDGTGDYVNVADPALPTGAYTIELWAYFQSSGAPTESGAMSEGTTNSAYNTFNFIFDSAGIMNYNAGNNSSSYHTRITNATWTANIWQHWVVVYDGSSIAKLYRNGVEVGSDTSASALVSTSYDMRIGQRIHSSNSQNFNGLIDEVAIYNRDLSASEIKAHYMNALSRIKFQARSGSTNPPTGDFLGLDGTDDTFLETVEGTNFHANVADNQYFQYRAYLENQSGNATPALESVTVNYNTGSTFADDTRAEFDSGTYSSNTQWYADEVKLGDLDADGDSGTTGYPTTGTNTFISQTYDAGSSVNWTNLSWEEGAGYGDALDAGSAPAALDTDTPGLVSYWPMDSSWDDAVTSSANNGDASGGSATFDTSNQKVGDGCGDFPGSAGDDVLVGNVGTIKSVEFWVNDSNATDGILELINNSTYISIGSSAITTTGFNADKIVYVNGSTSSAALASGWNHVAITTATGVAAATMNIGEANGDTMTGKLDEVSVYFRSLSAGEIRQHYLNGVGYNGLVGLWHLDEGSVNGTSGEVVDALGNNSGTAYGTTGTMAAASGKFGTAFSFDGTGDYVAVGTGPGVVKTVSFWVNPTTTSEEFIDLNGSAYISSSSGTVSATGWTSPTIYVDGSVSSTISAGTWQHIAVTTGTSLNASALNIAKISTNYLAGLIDEVAIYSRALSAEEVADHFRRGAANLTMQYSVDGGAWSGALTSNSNTLSGVTGQTMQYKATLSTTDYSTTPKLQGVTLSQGTYPTDNPYVVPNTGQVYVGELTSFDAVPTGSPNVTYQLSNNDGANWYWYSSGWTAASTASNSSSATVVNSNIASFYDTIGSGTFKFKAFLNSTGSQVELSQVDLGYSAGQISLTSPNGAEKWIAGTSQNITWTSSGTVSNNLTLTYSTDGGSTYPGSIDTGVALSATPYAWTVPTGAESTQVRVKIEDGSDSSVQDESDVNFTVVLPTTYYTLSSPADITAGGTRAAYTVTRYNASGLMTVGAETVYLYSNSSGANAKFYDAATAGNVITSVTIADGQSAANLWYYDEKSGDFTITASDATPTADGATGITDATDALTVDPAVTDSYSLNSPIDITAGGSRAAYTVTRYDVYSNLVTSGAETVYIYTNSGGANAAFYDAATAGNVITSMSIADTASTANFWYYDELSGSFTITASDATPSADGATGIDDATDALTVDPAVTDSYSLNSQADITAAGARAAYTVTRYDVYSNLRTAGAETVYLYTSSDGVSAAFYDASSGGSVITSVAIADTASSANAWYYDAKGGDFTITASDNNTAPDGATNIDDATDALRVNAPIAITAPNGTETWYLGDSQNITWTYTGAGNDNLTIQLSTDSGATYPTTIATGEANDGTYAWTVTDIGTATDAECRIKIFDASFNVITDESNADFTILLPTVTVTAPNGGEAWLNSAANNITWTSTGGAISNNLTLQHSTDSGSTWTDIATGVALSATPYSWTPTGISSTQVRIKIFDADKTTVIDTSDADFTISRGTISITSPDGGEGWYVYALNDITWTSTGTVENNLTIQYSSNNGSSWTTVTTGQTDDGLYSNWAVPDAVSANCLVKIFDANQAATVDTSNAVFSILEPTISVTSPNDGTEQWIATNSYDITWTTSAGVSENLTFKYSTNSGSTYPNTITTGQANDGTYSWIVPVDISSTVRVKIEDGNRTATSDESDTDFSILETPTVTVTAPNGGEAWYVNTSHPITWSSTGAVSNNLEIRYSTDGGSTWPAGKIIATGEANDSTYTWASIPDDLSVNCKIKITDLDAPVVTDTGNNPFVIQAPTITVSIPNGGQTWIGTSTQNITWTTSDGVNENLTIQYSTNSGSTWTDITTGEANDGTYAWTLPDIEFTTCRIQIIDADRTDTFDTSNADFEITAPSVTITAPNGGEAWKVGTSHNITWDYSDMVSNNLTIRYSTNGGTGWTDIATTEACDGTYTWTSIPDAMSTNCLIKIFDADRIATTDDSDSAFEIATPTITVTAPNGAESWIVGTQHNITWTSEGTVSGNLTIQYSSDAAHTTWNAVASSQANDGTYFWTAPDDVSATVKVRIFDADRTTATDDSDADFAIAAPTITVTAPNGAESWIVGTPHDITWSTSGGVSSLLTIQYSTDSGSTWSNVAANQANDGTYSWTVTDAESSTARIKIYDQNRTATEDTSNADFTIATPTISITAPNGGESWIVGTDHAITWSTTGTFSNNLTIQYSTNSGSTWTGIATVQINDSTYTWSVANAESATAMVRIFDANRTAATDDSDAIFTIATPTITITAPNGGEEWVRNKTESITWTTSGSFSNNLTILYSTNSGSTWTGLATGEINDGTYSWDIPLDMTTGTTTRIKVFDANRTAATDTSDADFTILGEPTITIISPNGAEQWIMGTARNITWTSSGGVSENITIKYSSNNGSTWTTEATGEANDGTYAWTVPDTESAQYLIRVYDGSDASVTDDSDAVLSVVSSTLTITSPAAGDVWYVGDVHNITWTTEGTVNNNLTIQYSSDNGSTWINEATGEADGGTYAWTVDNVTSSTTCYVRVFDASHSTTTDDAGAFTIGAKFSITAPNGAERWFAQNSHTITWTTDAGSAANVKLEYSIDFGANWNTIISSTTNDGSYAWTLPNLHMTSATALVRLSDVLISSAQDTSAAGFTIDYYDTTWNVKDNATQIHLDQLSVTDSTGWSEVSLTSPIIHSYPYGTAYTTTWTRVDYADKFQRDWTANADQAINIQMSASAITPNFNVKSNFAYDDANIQFKINSWVERGGIIMTAPTSCTIYIYDSLGTLLTTLTSTTDTDGIFWQIWLQEATTGSIYFAKTEIVYGGDIYSSGLTYSVSLATLGGLDTTVQDIYTSVGSGLATTIGSIQTDVNTIETSVGTGLGGKVDDLNTDVATLATAQSTFRTSITTSLTNVASDVTAILEDTGTTLPAQIAQDVTAALAKGVQAKLLSRPVTIKSGSITPIRYRTTTGLSPVVSVYDGSGVLQVNSAAMIEVSSTGVYEYDLNAAYGTGDYIIICEEATKNSMDSMTLTVSSTDLETIQFDITSIDGKIDTIDTNLDTVLTNWGSYTATDIIGYIDTIETNLGTSSDTSADATVFGKIAAVSDKWGTRDADALYTAANNAYTLIGTVRAELGTEGATTTAYADLQTLKGYVDTVETSLATIDTNVDTIITTLAAIDTSISTVETKADEIIVDVANIEIDTSNISINLTPILSKLGAYTDTAASSTIFGKIAAARGDITSTEADIIAYIDTVETVLGTITDDSADTTVFGKLDGIEDTLVTIGSDATNANTYALGAKTQASTAASTAAEIKALVAAGDSAAVYTAVQKLAADLKALQATVSSIPEAVNTDSITATIKTALADLNKMAAKEGYEGLVPAAEGIPVGGGANAADMQGIRNSITELKGLMAQVRSLLDRKVNAPIVRSWMEGR